VTYGFGKIAPSIMMWPQLFPNPNLPKYDYDPAMAKQLLKDGNWDPSRKLIFGALAAQGAPNNTYAAMINMWKAVGVDVEYKPFDPANSTVVWKANPHEWDVMQTSYAWLAYDPTSTFQEFGCDVPGNYPHYCNQDYDSTMKEAIRTGDQDKAVELFRKVQTTVATDLPYMPIWIEPEIWAINKRMHGGVLGRGPLNDVLPELWWKE
jgi:peptide/nickel transport system substrate-binding protein